MNEHKKPRGHKAHNDKDSILADTKNLLFILYPAVQRMPKIDRIEGAPVEMKRALQGIIRHFSIAKECQEVRVQHIREIFGEFGILLANFELCIAQGLFTDKDKLRQAIGDDWWQWLDWDARRQCVVSKPEYNFRARLNSKYHLKLKRL